MSLLAWVKCSCQLPGLPARDGEDWLAAWRQRQRARWAFTAIVLVFAYTTVATILMRLHRKGLVGRRREPFKGAERYIYSYKDIEPEYIDEVLEGLASTFGVPGIAHLAERLQGLSGKDLRRLQGRQRA